MEQTPEQGNFVQTSLLHKRDFPAAAADSVTTLFRDHSLACFTGIQRLRIVRPLSPCILLIDGKGLAETRHQATHVRYLS